MKPTSATSLRSTVLPVALLGFLAPLATAAARPVRAAVVDAAQAALQVVEDEPDRRLRPRGRDDAARAVTDDEDAPRQRRHLQLGQLALARAQRLCGREELAGAAYELGGARL